MERVLERRRVVALNHGVHVEFEWDARIAQLINAILRLEALRLSIPAGTGFLGAYVLIEM